MSTPQTHQAETDGISLLKDEVVLENMHPSWMNWAGQLMVAGLIFLAALGSGDGGTIFGGLVIGGGIFGYVYLARKKSRYIVTNERVKKKIGLLKQASGEARHEDIRSVATESSLISSMGSVLVDSAAAGGTLGIDGVSDYEGLANTIRQQQQEASKRTQ